MSVNLPFCLGSMIEMGKNKPGKIFDKVATSD
jgi:hypothetical protein